MLTTILAIIAFYSTMGFIDVTTNNRYFKIFYGYLTWINFLIITIVGPLLGLLACIFIKHSFNKYNHRLISYKYWFNGWWYNRPFKPVYLEYMNFDPGDYYNSYKSYCVTVDKHVYDSHMVPRTTQTLHLIVELSDGCLDWYYDGNFQKYYDIGCIKKRSLDDIFWDWHNTEGTKWLNRNREGI